MIEIQDGPIGNTDPLWRGHSLAAVQALADREAEQYRRERRRHRRHQLINDWLATLSNLTATVAFVSLAWYVLHR